MNTNEKQAFFDVMTKTSDLYDKKIERARVSVYWDALKHRTIEDIKIAINRHIQDADRGRFFPLPADIAHQLSSELNAWLTANEAWAACPKDEIQSSAMCDEMSRALFVAQDLISVGDLIAARMAFIEHYNRLMEIAKSEGRKPKWFPSYGTDKTLRFNADRDVIERTNLALPQDKKLALPEPENINQIEYEDLMKLESEHRPERTSEAEKKGIANLKNALKPQQQNAS